MLKVLCLFETVGSGLNFCLGKEKSESGVAHFSFS